MKKKRYSGFSFSNSFSSFDSQCAIFLFGTEWNVFLFRHLPLSLPFDLYNLWWRWRTKVLDLCFVAIQKVQMWYWCWWLSIFCFGSNTPPLSTNRFSTLILSFVHNLLDQYRKTPLSPPLPSFVPVLFCFALFITPQKSPYSFVSKRITCYQKHTHTHYQTAAGMNSFLLFILFFK